MKKKILITAILISAVSLFPPSLATTADDIPQTKIQLETGEITLEEFRKIVDDLPLNIVMLDVRPANEVQSTGILKGAVNIPYEEIIDKERYKELPQEDKEIIIYSSKSDRARNAYWKLLNVIPSGKVRFLKAFVNISPDGKFTITPDLLSEGEISIEEFRKIVENHPENIILLDVRSTQEIETTGMFKGAINIPYIELTRKERYKELPKDKEIIIYCAVGQRARMAYRKLKSYEYENVKFLKAIVNISRDGSYTITK